MSDHCGRYTLTRKDALPPSAHASQFYQREDLTHARRPRFVMKTVVGYRWRRDGGAEAARPRARVGRLGYDPSYRERSACWCTSCFPSADLRARRRAAFRLTCSIPGCA